MIAHDLVSTARIAPDRATWVCTCGSRGSATGYRHENLIRKATINHRAHARYVRLKETHADDAPPYRELTDAEERAEEMTWD